MRRSQTSSSRGFTLVEAMIAVAVLMIGVLVLEKNIIASLANNTTSRLSAMATSFASSQMERLQARPFNDPQLGDVNNDGRNGLNSTVAPSGVILADHAMLWSSQSLNREGNTLPQEVAQGQNLTSAGPWNFVVFWNIDNSVDPQKKEIRLICRWRNPGRPSNIDQIRIPKDISDEALRQYFTSFGNQELVLRYVKVNL